MKELMIYQFEVAACLGILSIVFIAIWRKDQNFQFKRLLLLQMVVISFVIPLFDFQIAVDQKATALPVEYLNYLSVLESTNLQTVVAAPGKQPGLGIWQIISWIWIAGTSVMFLRMLFSIIKIYNIVRSGKFIPDHGCYLVSNDIQSFSFLKYIVINKNQFKSRARDYVLNHEKSHRRHGHSFDVLALETITAFQWFNPAIWLLAKESRQNLEYLADQSATKSMTNLSDYQYAIVHHASDFPKMRLVSEFSKSNLKNRIIMMNRPNYRKLRPWKLLTVIPVLVLLLMSFSVKIDNFEIKEEITALFPILSIPEFTSEKRKDVKPVDFSTNLVVYNQVDGKDSIYNVVDAIPTPKTESETEYYKTITSSIDYGRIAQQAGISEDKAKQKSGKVFVQCIVRQNGELTDLKVLKGMGSGYDDEAIRVIASGPGWNAGKHKGKKVSTRLILPVVFGIEKKDEAIKRVIHGRVVTKRDVPVVGASIIVKNTNYGTITDNEGRFIIKVEPEHEELTIISPDNRSLQVPITEENEIEAVFSDRSAVEYAVEPVTTTIRGVPEIKNALGNVIPLYVVDGEIKEDVDFTIIVPEEIASVSVLKGSEAQEKYGKKGKNGVVIIEMK